MSDCRIALETSGAGKASLECFTHVLATHTCNVVQPTVAHSARRGGFGTLKIISISYLSLGKQNPNNHERPAEKFKFGILRALLERLQLGELRRKPGSLAVRAVGVPWKIHPTTPSATRYSSPGDTSAKLPLTSNSNSGICFSTPYLPFSPYFQVVN